MKCRVTANFKDKYNRAIEHVVGDVVEWDDKDRIADCVERGLVEIIKEAKPKTKTKKG